jgi:hypothetical protein
MIALFQEFIEYVKERKMLILLPVLIFILLLSLLVFVATSTPLAPFIYTLF